MRWMGWDDGGRRFLLGVSGVLVRCLRRAVEAFCTLTSVNNVQEGSIFGFGRTWVESNEPSDLVFKSSPFAIVIAILRDFLSRYLQGESANKWDVDRGEHFLGENCQHKSGRVRVIFSCLMSMSAPYETSRILGEPNILNVPYMLMLALTLLTVRLLSIKEVMNHISNSQRTCQPRTFNAQQIYEAFKTLLLFDVEV